MKRPDWDQLYITMCYLVGMRSRDGHTHVGSVIVDSDNVLVSTGYNSLPRGIEVDQAKRRLSRENGEKYHWMEHAERNAIYNAARRGTVLRGCKLYVPWTPCTDCTRASPAATLIGRKCYTPPPGSAGVRPSCSRAQCPWSCRAY